MAQRYYWLKMKKDFARDKRVKKLKRIPGGLNFAFIYVEIILSAIDTNGIIVYEGVEDTLAKEIALEIDEDPDEVQITISYLMSVNLLVDLGDGKFLLPYVAENLGSEGASAKRMRDLRARQKALECNSETSQSDAQASQCDTGVTPMLRNGDVEIDTDTEKRKYLKEIKKSRQSRLNPINNENGFNKPSIDEIQKYAALKGITIDAEEFWNYYETVGWICGKVPMKNWKTAVRAWVKRQERWGIGKPKNSYRSFQQNVYDFDQIEKDLIRN